MASAPGRMSRELFGSAQLRTDRDNEYFILSRVTRNIQQAVNAQNRDQLIKAIDMNVNLWTALAGDLAQPGNGLPDHVKSGLLSLAIFSIKHSHRVLSEDACPTPLIEVNLRIMKGLRGEANL